MTAHAALHWKNVTTLDKQKTTLSWIKEKKPSTIFLKEVGLCLSDEKAPEIDQVVALAALIRALIQPKPQGIKASELFIARLIPIIVEIATNKLYKSKNQIVICSQCHDENCNGASIARRHAAITVLCGIVSAKDAVRLSLDWGLIVVLIDVIVDGYTKLYKASKLNTQYRKKYSSLAPSVAIHPDASNGNVQSDEMYRLPSLCLRSLRFYALYYFPKEKLNQLNQYFTLQQSQLIKGGLLTMALEMQKSINGPNSDPSLIAMRKLQSSAYQLIKIYPDKCLNMMKIKNNKLSKRIFLPVPPTMKEKKNNKDIIDKNRPLSYLGELSENISIAASKQLELREKKRSTRGMSRGSSRGSTTSRGSTRGSSRGRVDDPHIFSPSKQKQQGASDGPSDFYHVASEYVPLAVSHQLTHLEELAKSVLGLNAMLKSSTSSLNFLK